MPCFLGCLALSVPRLVIIALVVFSDYIGRACATTIWPLLGFFFMPTTTLAYAFAMNSNHGSVSGIYLALVVIAVLIDLGSLGGGGRSARRGYVTVVRPIGRAPDPGAGLRENVRVRRD